MPSGQRTSPQMAKLIHNSYRKYKSHRTVASLLSLSKGAIASVLRRYDGDTGLPLSEHRPGARRATSPTQDAKIVELHRQNPEMSLRTLGQAVGVSEATVSRRIKESKEKPRRKKATAKTQKIPKTKRGDPKYPSQATNPFLRCSEANLSKNKKTRFRVEHVMQKKLTQPKVLPPKMPEERQGIKPHSQPVKKKQPPAEFVIFYCHVRPTVQAQNPDFSPAEVGKQICDMWNACSRPDRHKYYQLAGEISTAFNSDLTGSTGNTPAHSLSEADAHVSNEIPQSPLQSHEYEMFFIKPDIFKLLPEYLFKMESGCQDPEKHHLEFLVQKSKQIKMPVQLK